VRDLVAAVFQIPQEPDVSLPIGAVRDYPGEDFRHLGSILAGVLEVIEKLLVVGQKSR
jgi:hypothetical protein